MDRRGFLGALIGAAVAPHVPHVGVAAHATRLLDRIAEGPIYGVSHDWLEASGLRVGEAIPIAYGSIRIGDMPLSLRSAA